MPYVGQKPADIIATAVDTTTGTFSGDIDASTVNATGDTAAGDNAAIGFTSAEGLILTGQGSTNDVTIKNDADADVIEIPTGTVNVTMAGTLGVAGAVTANAGVVVDNITIDGTEIDLSSGDLTIDVAGDIILDADGDDIFLKNGGVHWGTLLTNGTPQNFYIDSIISDGDIIVRGNDGGSTITALQIDMSSGGQLLANPLGVSVPSYAFQGDTDTGMTRPTGNTLQFVNGGSESMRINSSGFIYVNTGGAEPSASQVGVRITGTQGHNFWRSANSGTGGYSHLVFNNANGVVGEIYTNLSGTVYATSSDYRLKENVVYDFDATTRLKQLKPCRFNFIADGTDNVVDGFLAHEVQTIVPEAISGEKDAMFEEVLYVDGDEIPDGKKVGDVKTASQINSQGIDQSKLVPLLTKALQEQQATIEALTARIVTLENA